MSATDKDSTKQVPSSSLSYDESHDPNLQSDRTDAEETVQLSIAVKRKTSGKTKVIAKGTGELAEQILQIAFDQGIKVRTDSDLAEILSNIDLESEIPLEALTAVATILNYVYEEQQQPIDESVK